MAHVCGRCQHANPAEVEFCVNCGTTLVARPAVARADEDTRTTLPRPSNGMLDSERSSAATVNATTELLDTLPSGAALLIVQSGPLAGSRFRITKDLTSVGRHPDGDIILDDVTVSRRHAEFHRQGTTFTVYDQGSLNGTDVNRVPIDHATLSSGDQVRIGQYQMLFLQPQLSEAR